MFKAETSTVVQRVFEFEKILYYFVNDPEISKSPVFQAFFVDKVLGHIDVKLLVFVFLSFFSFYFIPSLMTHD
jgi:hypothetical protein